jgi:hypothetical protein
VSSVTLSQALLKPNATETGWSFDGTDWTWVPKGAGGNSSKPEFHMGLADGPPFNGSFTPSANPTSADQSVPSPGFWASIQQASLPSFYIFPFSDAFLLGGSADRFVVGMTNAGGGTYKMTALGEVYIPIIPLFDS